MSDDNATELLKRSDRRFARRAPLDSFRQEIALHFCPWHASWTTELQWGEDFASHLVDGTPLLLARDFVGQIGSMLRPPGKQWFWLRTPSERVNNDVAARGYLDWRSGQMMRIMTDRVTGFHRSTKIADEFFGWFGDAVLATDLAADQASVRLHAYHTKDCVWVVGHENRVDTISRREMMTVRNVLRRFGMPGDTVHPKVREVYDKDPDTEIEVRHEVLPCEDYDGYKVGGRLRRSNSKWCSVWVDVQNKHVMRETDWRTFRYVVPRWVTLPHMPYAISPATTVALPDARLLQQQALALLEAAEKAVNPPLIATHDAVRGPIQLQAGGVTWLDRNYDEKTGEALRPMALGKNFGIGAESLIRTEQQLSKAFFLDILRMPDTRSSKSTVEIQFRIDEYVRAALPLFAPMQSEYSEALLFEIDHLIDEAGGYDGADVPDVLRTLDREQMTYAWDNPLGQMIERAKVQSVSEVAQLGQAVAALEAAAAQAPSLRLANTEAMFKEGAISLGAASWLHDEDEARAMQEDDARRAEMQQLVASAPAMAQVIDSGASAAKTASEIPVAAEPGLPLLPAPA